MDANESENDEILRVRIGADLKSAFFEICKRIDQTPSQIVRASIRQFVREHAQSELLPITQKRGRK